MRKKSNAFAVALREARAETRLPQTTFGTHIDAAPRSLTRWEIDGELPHVAQRTHMVVRLASLLSPAKLSELAKVLGVDAWLDVKLLSARAPQSAGHDRTSAALVGALLTYAEELNVSPREARRALGGFLLQMEAAGASIAETRVALEQRGSTRRK